MARQKRRLESNVVYHVFNRRTDRQCLFPTSSAYEDFERILVRAKQRYAVRLHAYCMMSTHWHFAVSAEEAAILQRFLQWIPTTHAVRFRFQTETRGHGHVYQDRYDSIPVEGVVSYTRLIRYIEANPLAAGLVKRAERWRWSSLGERLAGRHRLIDPGPWQLPSDWRMLVNSPEVAIELLPCLLGQVATFAPKPVNLPEFFD